MLFTSSCFNPGQQTGPYPCSRPCPTDVPVGRQTVSRLILVGSQSERCDLPGSASEDASGSKPWQEMRAQTPRIMKHERKHQGAFAKLRPLGDKEGSFEIEFEEPQRAITPGQAAVIYRNSELMGGGWIYNES